MNKPFCLLGLTAVLLFASTAQAAPRVIEVTSPGGIQARLMPTDRLPLLSLSFAFRGGVEDDPADKQGLASLSAGLLTEGAGPYDDKAFQDILAKESITLDVSASRDALVGTLSTLTRNQNEAFRLLALALTKPRFEAEAFERLRDQQRTAARMKLADPAWQARYALLHSLFGDHPYGMRALGTPQTIDALTRDDVMRFAQTHLAKDNLVVTAVGAITPQELGRALDQIFGKLPTHSVRPAIAEASMPTQPQTLLVPRAGTQTTIAFAIPSLKRQDPDWQAAQIANYILGGGGFVSRLMSDVREKNGLTYGIGTGIAAMEKASLVMGEMSCDNGKTAQAMARTRAVWTNLLSGGVRAEEVRAAKDFLTGSAPLAFDSTNQASGLLLALALDHLPADYLDHRDALIKAVTVDDVNRVLKKWFDPSAVHFALVGKPQDFTADQTIQPVKE